MKPMYVKYVSFSIKHAYFVMIVRIFLAVFLYVLNPSWLKCSSLCFFSIVGYVGNMCASIEF